MKLYNTYKVLPTFGLLALLFAHPAQALDVVGSIDLRSNVHSSPTGSRVYEDYNLHIATDDFLYLDAPAAVIAQNTLEVGSEFRLHNNKQKKYVGGSRFYDDNNLHIATDDELFLDATKAKFSGELIVTGTTTLNGGLTLQNQVITTDHIKDGQVGTADIGDDAITTNKIINGTILAADFADGAVSAASISDGSITTAKLADSAVTTAKIADGTIANADVSSSAAIAYSKLNLAGTIVNADISTSAAIALSKLAAGTDGQIIVANASGVPVYVALSGDATIGRRNCDGSNYFQCSEYGSDCD